MTALYQAGRPPDALDRYQDYRMLLAGELGLDPSPALRDLQARILRHDLAAAPRPARRRVPAAPAWLVTSTAFVGREGETAALLEAVGTHRLVTVTGTGGVGKTRLVAEALGSLTERFGLPATVAELAGATTGQADRAVAAALGLGATGSVRAAMLEYLSISGVSWSSTTASTYSATPARWRRRYSAAAPASAWWQLAGTASESPPSRCCRSRHSRCPTRKRRSGPRSQPQCGCSPTGCAGCGPRSRLPRTRWM